MSHAAEVLAYTRYQPPDGETLPPDLPTMYDLPSEDPEESGLPDDFHYLQPQLLRETFRPPRWPTEDVYVASDMNLYYDPYHPLWHKRPDWFAVLGKGRGATIRDLRLSYVIWQEKITPYIILELLSPGTEDEDLGRTLRDAKAPPTKWNVYERILKVPFYIIYDRYANHLRAFSLTAGRYRALDTQNLWLSELDLKLGLWEGRFEGTQGKWLRWFDADGKPLPCKAELNEQEHLRAENAEQRAARLEAQLRAAGIEPGE